jgi:hypothetical protein
MAIVSATQLRAACREEIIAHLYYSAKNDESTKELLRLMRASRGARDSVYDALTFAEKTASDESACVYADKAAHYLSELEDCFYRETRVSLQYALFHYYQATRKGVKNAR